MDRKKLNALVQQIVSGDWREKREAANILALDASPETTKALITLLKNSNGQIRNTAALALRKIGDEAAILPLFEAIKKPENCNDRSTLVYALETHDCTRHFLEIFELALAPKVDVQWSANEILYKGFYTNDDEIDKAARMLDDSSIEGIYRAELLSHLDDLRNDGGLA